MSLLVEANVCLFIHTKVYIGSLDEMLCKYGSKENCGVKGSVLNI